MDLKDLTAELEAATPALAIDIAAVKAREAK